MTYDSFREEIKPFNYGWQPFEVITSDGYKLTMFRITGPLDKNDPEYFMPDSDEETEEKQKEYKRVPLHKSVLMMHGHHVDSEVWFREKNMGKPLPL